MDRLVARMVGAAGFNVNSYEAVEADSTATWPAVGVVIVSSIGAAIGAGAVDPRSIVGLVAGVMLSWLIWVMLTLFIGTRLLPGRDTKSDFGEVLRTTGFSSSIGILRVFGLLPVVGWPIFAFINIWMLLTFVVAIRQALDYSSTSRAFAVCLLGWLIHGILFLGFVRAVI